jgi:Gram-negative bacterial TonB protein C-terminal
MGFQDGSPLVPKPLRRGSRKGILWSVGLRLRFAGSALAVCAGVVLATVPRKPTRYPIPVGLSILLHGAFLACLLFSVSGPQFRPVPTTHFLTVAQIEVAGGSHAVKIRLPRMQTSAQTRNPSRNDEAITKTILPVQPVRLLKRSGGGAPALPHAGNGSGQAQTGNGSDAEDLHPAFPIFSPRPPVTDRALLPLVENKIVVDVHVDVLGAVVGETLVKGMGNQLDRIVLDTVKSWRFQPATINGKPVPTDAELIFPFNRDYPITVS